jgi:hypothetical protein
VSDGSETRPLGADFTRPGTSSYFRTQTADNDERLLSGEVIHHPPVIERIQSNPELAGVLSADARRRLGLD